MSEKSFVITADGSHTLYVPELNEHYHSVHGAVAESCHVFIETGLKPKLADNRPLHVLEIGLGTGLNAALTCLEAEKAAVKIHYTGIEAYPLSLSLISQLNYSIPGDSNRMHEVVMSIHEGPRNSPFELGSFFSMNYMESRAQDVELKPDSFDVVYCDAFSPDTQPDMWTLELFSKIFLSMKPGAFLTTYVAKGAVRRMLKECGFIIEKLPGFAGKREMTRAIKPQYL